jgi:DNA-binding CsgD family transcriptional regulator
MFQLWDRLLALLHIQRTAASSTFELEADLQMALVERAGQEHRPEQELQLEIFEAGLAQLQTSDELKARWETLSPREREVTALTCLKYTNRQMAARLKVSPDTVKGYMRKVLLKFNLHSKAELRMLLEHWDFSEWGPRAQG